MTERRHITLMELQGVLKRGVEGAVPLPVWVAAEIGELKVNRSGHCYVELVEKGGDNGVPRARVGGVIWRNSWAVLRPYFAGETGSELGVGMKVLLRATATYHELYGLSLVITDIDPLYTVGDLERQRQATITRLREDGVYDMNRGVDMPPVVQRVAVVSSAGAAGYRDFVNELAASGYRFEVTLFDAVMQGHGAEESIIGALERIDCDAFDVVVIIRGGGSQADLSAFDSYRLAGHVAQFPLPVVAGIGHDKDQSVVDLVAHLSLKTPTAVAGWLVAGLAAIDGNLERFAILLRERAMSALARAAMRLDTLARIVSARDPASILSLGFAVVRHGGRAVTDASSLQRGDRLEIEFAHGKTTAKNE